MRQVRVWSYNRAEVEHINHAISLVDWQNMFLPLDASEQAKLFNETLLNIFSNFIPRKTIKCKFKEPPWMSKEIKTSMRKKNRLYKKYVSNGCNADDIICLNNQSIYCAELISLEKDNHYKSMY